MDRTVAGTTLHDIFNDDKYKEFRRLMSLAFDNAVTNKYEYGGVIYINDQTGAIKLAGPKTANPPQPDTADLQQFAKIPAGYTHILAAYHSHPFPTQVSSCAPSGIQDGKGDVGKAKSDPWNYGFFLVLTGFADPKKGRDTQGKCEVVAEMESSATKNKYRVWYVNNA